MNILSLDGRLVCRIRLGMDEFLKLRAELSGVKNLAALHRVTGLSRDHLQRIRDGRVNNTTLTTMQTIRKGIRDLKSAPKKAA